MQRRRARSAGSGGAITAAVAIALAPAAQAQPSTCAGWEVEYALSANLRLSETPLGQGDGVYPIGPGRAVLRFDDRDGEPAGRVIVASYEIDEHFTVRSKALFWTTTVITDAETRATPDASGGVAEGALAGSTIAWATPFRGYRTDGTLSCEGALCGKFGAPPPGRSKLQIGPLPVEFRPFELASDRKTFTMPYTFVVKTDMPMQTAHVALAGREVRRACVPR
jgi:hypothetical protein